MINGSGLGWRRRQHHICDPWWFREVPETLSGRSPKHTAKSQSTWRLCHTLQFANWHIIWASQPHNRLSRAHVYSSFHRFGNRFRGWITHPRLQSRNLSLKFHIQWPFLQTHTVLSLRQPRLECSKEAETRFCSCTGTLMGRGGSLQKRRLWRRHSETTPQPFSSLPPTPSWKTHQDASAFCGHLDSLMRASRITEQPPDVRVPVC